MSHNFLFEIGLEEMPARVILDLEQQLSKNVKHFLDNEDIDFNQIKSYSTPRRLAVIITGLPEKQADTSEVVKGPSKKIAQDSEGNWTKAAIGFSKGQGKDVEDIVFKDVGGEEYVFIEKHTAGKSISEVLENITQTALALNFPVSMKWSRHTFRYIRPVHTLITMLDDQLIPTSLLDVKSSNISLGHRFLGEKIEISSVNVYESLLQEQYVIADRDKRKNMIAQQIEELCQTNNWQVPLYNQSLLNEVTDLVEFPTVFFGEFDGRFLDVPEQILETSMADHQRYFPVRSTEEAFLPYFIGVRNGDDHLIENVIKGNEKVLIARLEDAKFFYEEDKNHSIEEFVDKLSSVTYHEKLGSMIDKQERVHLIINLLAEHLSTSKENINSALKASEIYKYDLMTNVVDEFSTLQGYIGEVYAKEKGVDKDVAKAIGEQYLPTTSGGNLPKTDAGAILALADKLESLIMFFSIGLVPTGSNDPFALRRTAYGLVRILEDRNIDINFSELFNNLALKLKIEDHSFISDLELFIRDRLNQYLKDQYAVAHDIRQAAIASTDFNPALIIQKALVLSNESNHSEYKLIGESLSRVANMANKEFVDKEIELNLAQSQSEKDLIEKTEEMTTVFNESNDAQNQFNALRDISPKIEAFFENNMVNATDEAIRTNRYALLSNIYKQSRTFADFNQLITK